MKITMEDIKVRCLFSTFSELDSQLDNHEVFLCLT